MPYMFATLPFATTAAVVAIFALWSRRGLSRLGKTAAGPTYRSVANATVSALGLTLALAAVAILARGLAAPELMAPAVGGCLSLPVLLHAAMDPTRRGFWHHRRVRPLGILAFAVLGAVLGRLAADPVLTAPIMAIVIFQRHLASTQAIAADAHEELAAIRQKLVVRATTAANERTLRITPAASVNDKLPKAG